MESLETLPDQTILVTVSGIKYRGFPAPKMREIVQNDLELKQLRFDYSALNMAFSQYKTTAEDKRQADLEVAHGEAALVQLALTTVQGEYEKELKLRQVFQKELEKCHRFLFWRVC